MKATVLYVSESRKSVTLSVEQKMGPVLNRVSGFIGAPEGHTMEKGEIIDIPANSVVVEKRAVPANGDYPATTMDFLTFS